jgi:hypothetical protein
VYHPLACDDSLPGKRASQRNLNENDTDNDDDDDDDDDVFDGFVDKLARDVVRGVSGQQSPTPDQLVILYLFMI